MRLHALVLLAAVCLVPLIAGCGASAVAPTQPGAEDSALSRAAAEATAIVGQAQATAMVLQAQAAATALIAQSGAVSSMPEPTTVAVVAGAPPAEREPAGSGTPTPTMAMLTSHTVEIIRVGLSGEGDFIHVQFAAPPDVAEHWWQGSVSVVDEATGTIHNEIPVMPKIGPLFGKPKRAGQVGYVMLVNAPPSLRPGALVTVVLGNFKQEHVVVR